MSSDTKAIVQVLFPMGGLGSRFADAGEPTPKPLIDLSAEPGKTPYEPMIGKAVSSFKRLASKISIRPIFIVRKEHNDEHKLSDKIRALGVFTDPQFVELARNTGGAVETCMEAAPMVDPRYPIVVMDCDLYFQSAQYETKLLALAERAARIAGGAEPAEAEAAVEKEGLKDVDGLLLFFNSKNKRYSYAKFQEGTESADGSFGRVERTAEKDPISPNALIGAYGFATGAAFVKASRELLAQPLDETKGRKEYYLSLLYNFLLRDGRGVVAVRMDEYGSFGTPEELALFRAGKQSYVTEA